YRQSFAIWKLASAASYLKAGRFVTLVPKNGASDARASGKLRIPSPPSKDKHASNRVPSLSRLSVLKVIESRRSRTIGMPRQTSLFRAGCPTPAARAAWAVATAAAVVTALMALPARYRCGEAHFRDPAAALADPQA